MKVNRGHSDLGTRLNFETRSEEDPGKEVTLTRAPAHTGGKPIKEFGKLPYTLLKN